mmetsp:Transcript_36757/g.75003  ORF Transcript_36757/g.75003 Transcript_36757/m.75003 type:complete len:154 (+) Transcript_36757:37-498(+)
MQHSLSTCRRNNTRSPSISQQYFSCMCKHGLGNMTKFSCRRKTVALVVLAVALVSIKNQSIPSKSAVQGGLMDTSYEEVLQIEKTKEERGPLAKVEPYLDRWDRRFKSSAARGKVGGYVFFKHIRKAGGTTLRRYVTSLSTMGVAAMNLSTKK